MAHTQVSTPATDPSDRRMSEKLSANVWCLSSSNTNLRELRALAVRVGLRLHLGGRSSSLPDIAQFGQQLISQTLQTDGGASKRARCLQVRKCGLWDRSGLDSPEVVIPDFRRPTLPRPKDTSSLSFSFTTIPLMPFNSSPSSAPPLYVHPPPYLKSLANEGNAKEKKDRPLHKVPIEPATQPARPAGRRRLSGSSFVNPPRAKTRFYVCNPGVASPISPPVYEHSFQHFPGLLPQNISLPTPPQPPTAPETAVSSPYLSTYCPSLSMDPLHRD
ncbi:hypothetical protein C8J57DRAFT_1224320 [Mycena rebaudengoi]|nr:hypothetical protein C8J57DRAFT_1224320 [Mycena rebaudengoi]